MATGVPAAEIAVADGMSTVEVRRPPRRFLRVVLGNRKAAVGALILLVMVFVSAFPGVVAPYDPHATIFHPDLGPSSKHLLGTTSIGQDVFSQLIWSTRLTLVVTLVVSLIAT